MRFDDTNPAKEKEDFEKVRTADFEYGCEAYLCLKLQYFFVFSGK